MSVSLKCWKADGTQFSVTAPQAGMAHDLAEEQGAARIVDGLGEIFIKLSGEWIGIGYESGSPGEVTTRWNPYLKCLKPREPA